MESTVSGQKKEGNFSCQFLDLLNMLSYNFSLLGWLNKLCDFVDVECKDYDCLDRALA